MAPKPRSTKPDTEHESEAPTREDLEAVSTALEAALAGIEILDRSLEFNDGARADLAGVDAGGRLVLVYLAGEDEDRSALEALDLLAFARRQTLLIARHLGSPKIVEQLDPRVIVVMDGGDGLLGMRLSALGGAGLELLELGSVKSAAGTRSYLMPHTPDPGGGSLATAGVDRFLEALPTGLRELGHGLCESLSRMDDDLNVEASAESVTWYFQDRPLARLETRGGRLRGVIGAQGRAHDLSGAMQADEFLEEALSRLVAKLGHFPAGAGDSLQGGPAVPTPGAPLLTPEEIEAFRE